MKIPLSLFLVLTAGAVLTTSAAPAAKPGKAASKAAVPAVPMGTVVWKGTAPRQAMLFVQAGKDDMEMKQFGKDGTLKLPVGEQIIPYLGYTVDTTSISVNCNPPLKLMVAEGKSVEVAPVAVATIKVTSGKMNDKREISLDLGLTTAEGFKVSCRNAKNPDVKPGFRILDAAGKEVAKGTFEFG